MAALVVERRPLWARLLALALLAAHLTAPQVRRQWPLHLSADHHPLPGPGDALLEVVLRAQPPAVERRVPDGVPPDRRRVPRDVGRRRDRAAGEVHGLAEQGPQRRDRGRDDPHAVLDRAPDGEVGEDVREVDAVRELPHVRDAY